MQPKLFFNNIKKSLRSNSPEILTGTGVAGVVVTSYLTARATVKAVKHLYNAGDVYILEDDEEMSKELLVARAKETWTYYIPPAISGVVTIGCVIGAAQVNSRRLAAAISAYSITEKAFTEYQEKVVEQFGERKEQAIRDEIAEDKIKNTPPTKEVIVAGSGNVLCCELLTRRYFQSDMETLRKAQNDINASIINELYVTLSDFYDIIGLSHTSHSDDLGWDSDKMMELYFTTVLTEDGRPCLAFEYNYVKPID